MNTSNSILAAPTGRERWLPTLQLAMQEVFELMLGCPLTVPTVPPPEDGLDITSMVGLAGQLCGILSLRCSAKSAARMASRMLGVEPEKAGQEMWDAVGEICNMVAGNFKNKISGMGDGCMLSVPTVITGGDYSVHSMVNENLRTIFLFDGDPVVLTLEVHS
ncbi:MAG TPA: chemotaxis protein CheX [Candidatus Sulfotelmatobacter sp.]|nr:chemotaxis protein CheX [Candidatus Sulfotelmatobacter sp.]